MTEKYRCGKVYTVISDVGGIQYVGSTTQKLKYRMTTHKSHYNLWKHGRFGYMKSFEVLKYEDARIELLEEYPCESYQQLASREAHWIQLLECVNQNLPGSFERHNIKHECSCGGTFTFKHRNQHFRSLKHQAALAQNNSLSTQ